MDIVTILIVFIVAIIMFYFIGNYTHKFNVKINNIIKDQKNISDSIQEFKNSIPKTIEELYLKSSKDISKILPIGNIVLDVCKKLTDENYPWHESSNILYSREYEIWIANRWYGLHEIGIRGKEPYFLNQKEKEFLINYLEFWINKNYDKGTK